MFIVLLFVNKDIIVIISHIYLDTNGTLLLVACISASHRFNNFRTLISFLNPDQRPFSTEIKAMIGRTAFTLDALLLFALPLLLTLQKFVAEYALVYFLLNYNAKPYTQNNPSYFSG